MIPFDLSDELELVAPREHSSERELAGLAGGTGHSYTSRRRGGCCGHE